MSIQDKIVEIKKIVALVCDVVPQIVELVKEVVLLFKSV